MNHQLKQLGAQLTPFIIIGIAIALVVGFTIILFYVVLWGILLGSIIWIAVKIKNYFFPPLPKNTKGRVIEHDK